MRVPLRRFSFRLNGAYSFWLLCYPVVVTNDSYDSALFEQPKQIKHAFGPDFKQRH